MVAAAATAFAAALAAAPPIEDPPGEMDPEDMDPVVWDLRRERPPVEERDVREVTEELSVIGRDGDGNERVVRMKRE